MSLDIPDFINENNALQDSVKFHWMHWLIISLSLVLTIGAWYFAKKQVDEKMQVQFDRQAEHIIELVEERMSKYEDALWSGVAALHAKTHNTNYKKWKKFSDTLRIIERYPGINGIGIIKHIEQQDISAHLEKERKLRPDYHVHPAHDEKEYWPIVYIEPVELNKSAVGLDIAHEFNRLTAAKQARDTGTAQITGPITLVQDKEKTPGFLFYVPFYEDHFPTSDQERQELFLGLVYAPFITKNLMEGALERERRQVALKITDGDTVIYNEHQSKDPDYDHNSAFERKVEINKYGRKWVFDIKSKKSFHTLHANNQPIIILVGGIIIDSLLFLIFLILTKSNKKSLKYAKKITSKLEQSIKFQNLVLNTIPSFIFVKNRKFEIVSANKHFIENYPEEDRDKVIGYTTLEKYKPEEADVFLENDKIAFEEGISDVEETIKFPDGQRKILNTKKILFTDKDEEFILGVSNDITIIKNAEKEILRSNIELEKFAYLASHDLQEPLRMVKNFTQILHEEYNEKFDEQASLYMKHIIDASDRMQHLVRDLLEYSRVQESGIEHQETDTKNCVNAALENLDEAIRESNAKITFGELPIVQAIPMRMTRLFQNLIGNAIKFNDSLSPKIEIGAVKKKGELNYFVKDNGIGVPEPFKEAIFKMCKRVHTYLNYPGQGLGLTICKKIVERHNGKLWIEDNEPNGSIFYFTLPQ